MHIFFSVGEASGDHHAAQLIQELRWRNPEAKFSGFGGPQMQEQGLETLYPLTELAVMGISDVIPLLGQFLKLARQAEEFLKEQKPAAVVLIDYPGFNWWIAKAAKRAGIPVLYYCPPQLWAWGGWRLAKVRRWVDHILSVLPFEAEWYRQRGISVEYVGHPFFDEINAHRLDGDCCDRITSGGGPIVALLPGSRKQEVNLNFPIMLEVVRRLNQRHPTARFPVACYRRWHYDRCRELMNRSRAHGLPMELFCERTPEVIESADCALMVSGSVSLELLARRTPAVVQYRAPWLMGILARLLIQVKYMSLPNLMLNRLLMPEVAFMGAGHRPIERLTALLDEWLSHPEQLAEVRSQLEELAEQVAQTGGISRAADAILNRLELPRKQRRAA